MPSASNPKAGPGRTEFVLLISTVMMTVAFAIDSMLPALPQIGQALGVTNENDRPVIITMFIVGFSVALFFAGTLSDQNGRRKMLLLGLAGYVLASLACTLATTFGGLLAARFVQGMMAGIGQVVIRSIVRDKFEGRDMAQVMSLASMVFMAAPILAPAMGQLVLSIAPWRWLFGALAMIGLIVLAWSWLRIEETLPEERRVKISRSTLKANARLVLTDRMSIGYSLAGSLLAASLFGFLLSIQQIFEQRFGRMDFLPTGFAIMSVGMAAASLLNAAIVKRYGMRRIGHAALIFYVAVAGMHLALAISGRETMTSFVALQAIMMIGHALCMGNFGAMSMENMGAIAGTANSIQGTLSNFFGLIIGTWIGQSFDGTTVPLYLGYFLSGLLALIVVFVTEGGRLFVARHELKPAE